MINFEGFFERVCKAFDVTPGRGAKAIIARELGYSDVAIGKWEKGEIPSLESLDRISNQTHTSIHWLLTGDGPQTVKQLKDADEQIVDLSKLEGIIRRVLNEELQRRSIPRMARLPIVEANLSDVEKPQSKEQSTDLPRRATDRGSRGRRTG